ncbi:MAG: hypothetical protein LAT56_00200 [Wenzhouxiangella sp.]|nr:hypothetical protein [Wenzhouxiangella sp.]
MSEVIRYELDCDDCYGVSMAPVPHGEFVSFDDYEKLLAERDKLRDENAELLAMLDADALTIGQLQFDNDRLRESLKQFVEMTDVQTHYPLETELARAALEKQEDER